MRSAAVFARPTSGNRPLAADASATEPKVQLGAGSVKRGRHREEGGAVVRMCRVKQRHGTAIARIASLRAPTEEGG
eukprot:7598062-Pyramimonas_sp.AAC.1